MPIIKTTGRVEGSEQDRTVYLRTEHVSFLAPVQNTIQIHVSGTYYTVSQNEGMRILRFLGPIAPAAIIEESVDVAFK